MIARTNLLYSSEPLQPAAHRSI